MAIETLSFTGGRLHADIETIRIFSPTEPERVDRWKSAFKQSYGMLYDLLEPHSENLPEIFVEAIEKRASVQRLYRWGRPENKGRKSCVIANRQRFHSVFLPEKAHRQPRNGIEV